MIKALVLGVVVMAANIFTSWSLGKTLEYLIGWFDEWADVLDDISFRKDKEGADKNDPNVVDIPGTSIMIDLQYHAVTVIYTWLVYNAIMLGAHAFAYSVF